MVKRKFGKNTTLSEVLLPYLESELEKRLREYPEAPRLPYYGDKHTVVSHEEVA